MLAFRVTCASGTMNTATVETPTCRFDFTGLGMTEGETLVARYVQEDILLLEIEGVDGGTRSAMAMRTTDSDDDLLLSQGKNMVTVKTEKACSVELTARGGIPMRYPRMSDLNLRCTGELRTAEITDLKLKDTPLSCITVTVPTKDIGSFGYRQFVEIFDAAGKQVDFLAA